MGLSLSGLGTYAATTYAISAAKIGYSDNSNLGVTNVQAAIDGTCTKFNEQLNELRESMYPIGSIYLSTSLSTTSAVATALGGTWETYGSGRTLIGSDGSSYQAGETGGATSVSTTLTTSNLPAHTHTVTAKGSVSSTFTGSEVTTSSNGSHTHSLSSGGVVVAGNQSNLDDNIHMGFTTETTFLPAYANINSAGKHTHTVTAKGTVSSTFTGSSATTSSTGSGTAFKTSTMQPYIVVYMYRRIS